jgi:hypothetical protein
LHSFQRYTQMENVHILNLPVELHHFIFDHCDTETIFSVCGVCKQLYAATNTYDRFKIFFNSKSKFRFKCISRLVRPEDIILLTFSNNYIFQSFIRQFFSLFDINQFKRLRSIILYRVTDTDLTYFLDHMPVGSQISLSIDSVEYQHAQTLSLISSAIMRIKLFKLCLNNLDEIIKHIPWLNDCGLSCLVTKTCDYNQYRMILHQLHHLRTFIMTDCTVHDAANTELRSNSAYAFSPSLTSLIISDCSLSTEKLELLLLLSPTLLHLKINSSRKILDTMFDGYYWQQLIQTKLQSLTKFEICIFYCIIDEDNSPSLHSLITPFEAPFWLKEKHWIITCEYIIKLNTIRLYTAPISFINSDSSIIRKASSVDSVCCLNTQSTKKMVNPTMNEVCTRSYPTSQKNTRNTL